MTATLQGWKEIAAALDVSKTTAQSYAARNVDPLPVFYDHARRLCLRRDAAQAWIDRNALHFAAYHALRRAGALPEQAAGDTTTG